MRKAQQEGSSVHSRHCSPQAKLHSTVWMFNTNITEPDLLDRGVPRIQDTWFVLLSTELVEEKIGKRMEKVKQINDKLPLLQDAQK